MIQNRNTFAFAGGIVGKYGNLNIYLTSDAPQFALMILYFNIVQQVKDIGYHGEEKVTRFPEVIKVQKM